MQAIVTLHDLIDNGEILRRREATGGGAEVHLDEPPAPQPVPVDTPGHFTLGGS
jgi:hypothetical protein